MTTDLQALAKELKAAGVVGRVDGNHIEFDDLTHALIDVWDNGEVTVGSEELKVDLRILGLIARHLGHAPAAPVLGGTHVACSECDGEGVVPKGERFPGWEHFRRKCCETCEGSGYVPAAPVPAITAEDKQYLIWCVFSAVWEAGTPFSSVESIATEAVDGVLSHPVLASRGLRQDG